MNIDSKDAKRGLYEKFTVTRNDGRSAPGEKHHGCSYYVLDLDHDPHAIPALRAYAESCEQDFPNLARDIRALIAGHPMKRLMAEDERLQAELAHARAALNTETDYG